MKGTIDGRRDLCGGRRSTDDFTAAHNMEGKFFRSVCYSTDGEKVCSHAESIVRSSDYNEEMSSRVY